MIFLRISLDEGAQRRTDFSVKSFIRHNSVNYVPTCNSVCFKMASILDFQSSDREHGGTSIKHLEVIILSMKSIARLKDKVKSLVY